MGRYWKYLRRFSNLYKNEKNARWEKKSDFEKSINSGHGFSGGFLLYILTAHTLHLSFRSQIQIRAGIYKILDKTWNKKANPWYLSCVTSNPKWHLSNIHLLRSRPRYWLLGNRIRAKQRVQSQWSKSQSEVTSRNISKMFSAKMIDDKAKFF